MLWMRSGPTTSCILERLVNLYTRAPRWRGQRAWEELLQPDENSASMITGGVVDRSQPHEERRPAGACRRSLRRWLLAASRMATTQGRCARVRSAPSRTSQSAYRALKQCASDQALCLSLYSLSTSGGSAGLRRQHQGCIVRPIVSDNKTESGNCEALGRPGTLHHGAELILGPVSRPGPSRAG